MLCEEWFKGKSMSYELSKISLYSNFIKKRIKLFVVVDFVCDWSIVEDKMGKQNLVRK